MPWATCDRLSGPSSRRLPRRGIVSAARPPSATRRPRSSSRTSSETSVTFRSCVARTNATPRSAWSRMAESRSSAECSSSSAVGSSARINGVPRSSARANAARACSPPERACGRSASLCPMPNCSEDLQVRSTGLMRSRALDEARVLGQRQVRDEVVAGTLEDVRHRVPAHVPHPALRDSDQTAPLDDHVPVRRPVEARQQPAAASTCRSRTGRRRR